jgi:hypothetical protein
MSTTTDRLPAVRTPLGLRVGPAAAIGIGLLVMGLAAGLIVGRLLAEPVEQQASPVAVQSAAKAPVLTWRDDYGTRHPILTAKAPVLTWRDDYGTRHPGERA